MNITGPANQILLNAETPTTYYKRVLMRGDVARIEIVPFSQVACNPKTRAEALELVDRWNSLVAEETARCGNSHSDVFYFVGKV
jgi:hypothetical protein